MQIAARALAADKFQKHSVTERMFEELARHNRNDPQATGAGGATTLEDLRKMDKIWHAIRNNPPAKPPQVVSTSGAPLTAPPQYDVIVCGGTLGIFLATALQRCGARVAVLERGKLQGRAQEWNVSRGEMARLVELGVLSQQQLEGVIGLEFNPVRIGFQVRHSKQYLQLAHENPHHTNTGKALRCAGLCCRPRARVQDSVWDQHHAGREHAQAWHSWLWMSS